MKRIYKKYKSGKGFTLLEMLIVVAILVILMGIGIVSLITVRKNLRQKQLDYMAELVYMAAQNNLVNLSVDEGNYDQYKLGNERNDVTQLGYRPIDSTIIQLEGEDYPTSTSICYTCSWSGDGSNNTAKTIVPSNLLSAEVWQGDWVIEYAPDEAFVYAVYYSEAVSEGTSRVQDYGTGESNNFVKYLRDKANRLTDGAQVGYYGGDVAVNLHDRVLEPDISVYNGEELVAYIRCVSMDSNEVSFDVSISDGINEPYEIPSTNKEITHSGNVWTCKVVLDSLESGKRFTNLCPTLTPGADITIEASVKSKNLFIDGRTITCDKLTEGEGAGETNINSLYASVKDGVAKISCARHLQNLDEDAFKSNAEAQAKITAAEQTEDISFLDDGIAAITDEREDWYTLYNNRDFDPITNNYLTKYDGKNNSIIGLHMTGSSSAPSGLFEKVSLSSTHSLTISNVTMSGERIDAGSYTGSLVGNITSTGSGTCTIENCFVILDTKTDLKGKDSSYVWLDGIYVGGLVGRVGSSSTLNIQNSCAASVVGSKGNATNVGGLVGYCAGNLTMTGSYADCYLTGVRTGGLVGYGNAQSNISITNSYAAGYQTATSAAAGIYGGTGSLTLSSCYTVCWYSDTADSVAKYATIKDASKASLSQVYYMAGFPTGVSATNDATNTTYGRQLSYEELSGNTTFTKEDGTQAWLINELNGDSDNKAFTNLPQKSTVPYNLRKQALSNYVYPSLAIAHYGDWNASFESGGLVYYEVYKGVTTPGIYGANMNTLSDREIVGDGYGIVYLESDYKKINTLEVNSTQVDLTTTFSFFGDNNISYVLVSLPKELNNTTAAPDSFWQQLSVVVDGNKKDVDTYYYNPHFAKAVETALEGNTLPDAPTDVSIRTARQLYNLSCYYDDYQYNESGTNSTAYNFVQELDIDYAAYSWSTYTNHADGITSQYPIGWTGNTYVNFIGDYDGGCHTIEGVSFNNGTCTGFIAQNKGRLMNIVLTAEYAVNRALTLDQVRSSDDCCVGVLAARNLSGGSISNCAVAGYSVNVNAYRDSSVYVGGLVGYNQGSILNSSAECPAITLTIDNSNVLVGGFVGRNAGSISSCYAINDINLKENNNTSSKNVVLAGFCAQNGPTLQNSYCCSSFTINNDSTSLVYNFAPIHTAGQTLSNCRYLNGGTFRFVGSTHSYSTNNTLPGDGEAIGYLALSGQTNPAVSIDGFGTAKASYSCKNTTDWEGSSSVFPFPASVKDASGNYVHYGDWITSVSNASAGVFYWEYESGGENPGYYISFTFDDTNLCTVHDDGGVVTQYGYGYYTKNAKIADTAVTLSANGLSDATQDTTVNAALKELMPGYTFHAYVTGTGNGKLYLTNDSQNGTWTLNMNGTTETYTVCPFFANAMSLSSDAAPGSETKPYQIRSTTQLQYINWNASTDSCTTDVSSDNYKKYPYLQYTTVDTDKNGQQTAAAVYSARPKQYWTQTHDIGNSARDTDFWPIAGTSTGATDVYALYKYNGAFNAVLYNWFGGSYDGGSYKMINMHISSELNNVAIFGYTCAADMHNIILYSNNSTVIERVTSSKTKSYGGLNAADVPVNSTSSYAIGGLVGIAYDYYTFDSDGNAIKATGDAASTSTISNCAIAGYTIRDNCRNSRISCGDVNIGGLFGIANANILNCSSVVDILVDCTFDFFACCGNNVRAGGIAGCCPYKLENCYSGGSISLGKNALYAIENGDGRRAAIHTGYNVLDTDSTGDLHYTHYYFAGICAGNFGGNFMNFTNVGYVSTWNDIYFANDARGIYGKTIEQTFSNCYTYMTLTDTAKVNSYRSSGYDCYIGLMDTLAIGGVPERVDQNGELYDIFDKYSSGLLNLIHYDATEGHVTIDNCYYLDGCVTTSQYYSSNRGMDETSYILGVRYVNSSYPARTDTVKDREAAVTAETITSGSMTLVQMSDGTLQKQLAKAGFQAVTTYEKPVDDATNGQYVGSKYSFPGENKALTGTVYPFPTIVTQTNAFNETVHVHYGSWPTGSLMFEEYYVTQDVLKDGNTVKISLKMQGDLSNLVAPALNFTDENGEALAEGVITLADIGGDNPYYDFATGYWVYTLTLKETGVFLVETDPVGTNKLTAKCQITVTGNFEISAEPVNATYGQKLNGFGGYEGELCCVTLKAGYVLDNGNTEDLLAEAHADKIYWTVSIDGYEDIVAYYDDGNGPYADDTAIRTLQFSNEDSPTGTGTIFDLLSEGNAIVQITAKYCPEGWTDSTPNGLVLTAEYAFEISVWGKTVIGVANTADPVDPLYYEISHKEPDVGDMTGAKVSYFSAAPQLDNETFFLYCSGTKAELADFLNNIESATVTVNSGSEDYKLILPTANDIVSVGDYQVAPLTLNHGGTEDVTNSYTVSLTFKKNAAYLVNGAEQTKTDQVYKLSIAYTETGCTQLTVDFAAVLEDERIWMDPILVPYGSTLQSQLSETVKLPDPPAYYKWADDSSWAATDGSTLTSVLKQDTVFTRSITGQAYTFHFYRSTGTTPADFIAIYGVTQTLPVYSELSIAQSGDSFYGWQVLDSTMQPLDGLVIDDDGAVLSEVLHILDSLITKGDTEFRLLAITELPSEGSQENQNNGESAETESPAPESEEAAEEPVTEENAETTPEAEPPANEELLPESTNEPSTEAES